VLGPDNLLAGVTGPLPLSAADRDTGLVQVSGLLRRDSAVIVLGGAFLPGHMGAVSTGAGAGVFLTSGAGRGAGVGLGAAGFAAALE
jgi:hypothetical protein